LIFSLSKKLCISVENNNSLVKIGA